MQKRREGLTGPGVRYEISCPIGHACGYAMHAGALRMTVPAPLLPRSILKLGGSIPTLGCGTYRRQRVLLSYLCIYVPLELGGSSRGLVERHSLLLARICSTVCTGT